MTSVVVKVVIRKAERADLPSIFAIYNDEVLNGVATLDLHPKTEDEWSRWFDAHSKANHCAIVAEKDGKVVGYASLSEYRSKEAYASTAELSVYVARNYRRQGVASKLMCAILEIARSDPSIHTVVSVITSGNTASAGMHEKFGFRYCGTLHEVGVKFGAFRDIDNYELIV